MLLAGEQIIKYMLKETAKIIMYFCNEVRPIHTSVCAVGWLSTESRGVVSGGLGPAIIHPISCLINREIGSAELNKVALAASYSYTPWELPYRHQSDIGHRYSILSLPDRYFSFLIEILVYPQSNN